MAHPLPNAPHDLPLVLLASFARALAHRTRTPLSVISNDLAYLETKYPHEELSRTSRNCTAIGNLLRDVTRIGLPTWTMAPVPLPVVAKIFSIEYSMTLPSPNVAVDLERLNVARVLIGEYLTATTPWMIAPTNSNREVTFTQNVVSPYERGSTPTFSSFTTFSLSRDSLSIAPPLIDAILFAHHCSTHLTFGADADVRISLTFPLDQIIPEREEV